MFTMFNNSLIEPKKIIYSKRKTITLIINSNGELLVRAPIDCQISKIEKFIKEKADWIIKKKKSEHNYSQLKFEGDEYIYLLGDKYKIILYDSAKIRINGDRIEIPRLDARNKLVCFLSRTAKKYITKRVEYIANLFEFEYLSISITSAHTRWGSCSYKNRLNFTYKLIMCPKDVIDYIIVHELCHTVEKNHSKNFWRKVKMILPNYKTYENWLKDNRGIINVI